MGGQSPPDAVDVSASTEFEPRRGCLTEWGGSVPMLGVDDDANVESGVCGCSGCSHPYLVSLVFTRGGNHLDPYCFTSKP